MGRNNRDVVREHPQVNRGVGRGRGGRSQGTERWPTNKKLRSECLTGGLAQWERDARWEAVGEDP